MSDSPQKTFTLDEAQVLLPVLESLLKQSISARQTMEAAEGEFTEVRQRIFISGGAWIDIPRLALRKAERDKAVQTLRDSMAEIAAIGVQVKDLDTGLLDFPCVVEGETVLLCWKLGEEKITHWHGTEEGFAGRKLIDAALFRKKKEKPN